MHYRYRIECRHFRLGLFLVFSFTWLANGAPKPDAHEALRKCNFYFEKQVLTEKIFGECTEKLGLKGKVPELNAPIQEMDKYYVNLRANQFDDKCLIKCLLEKLKLSNDDGTYNKKELGALPKGNMTQSVIDQSNELILKCEKKIGSMPEFEVKPDKSEETTCKKIAAIDECLYTGSKSFKDVC